MIILDLWGIYFHTVVVLGLGKDFLFKSILGHCDMGREIAMTVYHLVFFRFKSSVLTCFGSPQPSSFFRVQGRRDGGTEGRGAHALQILADQLTLSQEQIMRPTFLLALSDF